MNRLTALAVAASLVAGAAACGSHANRRATPITATTVVPPGHLPTVPDCGAGAYKPATLVMVCGVGTTLATGLTWSTWTTTSASGQGTVHLNVSGRPATGTANLRLDHVADRGAGPQYTVLTVTWIGASPDGRPADVYHLGTG